MIAYNNTYNLILVPNTFITLSENTAEPDSEDIHHGQLCYSLHSKNLLKKSVHEYDMATRMIKRALSEPHKSVSS